MDKRRSDREKAGGKSAFSVILYILSVIFLLYGIYRLISSINYIDTYDIVYVDISDSIQYVVSSSAPYFGFAAVLAAGARIIKLLSGVKEQLSSLYILDQEEYSQVCDAEGEPIDAPAEEQTDEITDAPLDKPAEEPVIEVADDTDADEMLTAEEPDDEEPDEEPSPAEEPPIEELTIEEPLPAEETAIEGSASAEKSPEENDTDETVKPDQISSSMIKDIFERK